MNRRHLNINILSVFLFITMILNRAVKADEFPELRDWQPINEVMIYKSDNLWEYIDGAAEQFLNYGFVSVRTREFANDTLRITVDVYDMGSTISAFGIFRAQCPPHQKFLEIGTQAFFSPPAQCLLQKDIYYIKVYAFQGDLNESQAKDLLASIAAGIPGTITLPQALALLPKKHRISGSEGYTAINYLGMSQLKNSVFADYQIAAAQSFQYFHLIPDSGETAQMILDKLQTEWRFDQNNGYTIAYRDIPYRGLCGLILTDRGLFGASDAVDLEQLCKRLKILQ
jgi:hypothetical protein